MQPGRGGGRDLGGGLTLALTLTLTLALALTLALTLTLTRWSARRLPRQGWSAADRLAAQTARRRRADRWSLRPNWALGHDGHYMGT